MPAKRLPQGFPEPEIILRDEKWAENFPVLLLRGIYDVMERERKAGRGSLMERYVKAFNVVMFALARTANPPRMIVANGIYTLTKEGFERDAEVRGEREMTKARQKELGLFMDRREMQVDTALKLKKLRPWIEELSRSLADKMPDQSPTIRAST